MAGDRRGSRTKREDKSMAGAKRSVVAVGTEGSDNASVWVETLERQRPQPSVAPVEEDRKEGEVPI